MICWCAYCQSYQGEIEPFEDYSMTHMICEPCEARDVIASESALSQPTVIATYYGELRALVRDGRIDAAIEQLDQAPSLGIRPADLMVGLVQPLIHWLAGFWASAQFDPEYERRFVAQLTLLLERLVTRYPDLGRYRNVDKPVVLLFSTTGNAQIIGLQIVELALATRAVTSKVIPQGNGLTEVTKQLLRHEPLTVGFSASTEEQLSQVERLVAGLRASPAVAKLRFLVGGLSVRQGRTVDPKLGLIHCRGAMDILRYVGSNTDETQGAASVFFPTESTRRRAQAKPTVS